MSQRLAGYSSTPLSKKLGIGEGTSVYAVGAPPEYRSLLEPLPSGVTFVSRVSKNVDLVHLFQDRKADLARHLSSLRKRIRSDAVVWVSWPKKTSKVPTDITEDVIRSLALPMGFVDIKVCAVTDVWSGLKLVIRKSLRSS
jgi:hypothetical protein